MQNCRKIFEIPCGHGLEHKLFCYHLVYNTVSAIWAIKMYLYSWGLNQSSLKTNNNRFERYHRKIFQFPKKNDSWINPAHIALKIRLTDVKCKYPSKLTVLMDAKEKGFLSHFLIDFCYRQIWKLETPIVLITPDLVEETDKENYPERIKFPANS